MSTTHHTLGLVQIRRQMVWVDEFAWSPVEKTTEYSTTGALLVDVGERLAGRPITLQATDQHGWLARSAVEELRALAADPEGVYVFTHADGREFTVMFAPDDPVSAIPIQNTRPELPGDDYPYVTTVRLIEIEA
ncbi:hypothetical protein [Acidovorax sp. A1169]|uniref:hypothetical protein n=1 Tax=Acidovorax sp. A1169 TaxID=3059524 RepID=UPI002737E23C|nr:hypothetical protein [Acidovorax sp. A1169]MDP4074200.1 hypothetical protein [Acidovorax sp. A1169]